MSQNHLLADVVANIGSLDIVFGEIDRQVGGILKYNNDGTKEGWPFNTAFYPILNFAWGGAWGGYKGVDETALPTTMKVDYVRVFQK